MKKIIFMVAAVALVGCVESPSIEQGEPKQPIRILSSIDGPATRVSGYMGNVWDENDRIGVYMYTDAETITGTGAALNVLRTHAGGGEFDGEDLFWPAKGAPANFVAYYPYHNDIHSAHDNVYPIDLTDQTANIDLMYAPVVRQAADDVNLQFSHQLSRLIFLVEETTGADPTKTTAIIDGLPATGKFDLRETSPAAVADNDATTTIPAKYIGLTGGKARVEAVVMPGAADYDLLFTFDDGTTVSAPMTGKTYLKGKQYLYEVSADAPRGLVNVVGGNITGWGDGHTVPEISEEGIETDLDDSPVATMGGTFPVEFTLNYPIYGQTVGIKADEWIHVTSVEATPVPGSESEVVKLSGRSQ